MLNIDSIDNKDILELVKYQQPASTAKITILRGYKFYARCVEGHIQEGSREETSDDAKKRYKQAIHFEEKLGSKKL